MGGRRALREGVLARLVDGEIPLDAHPGRRHAKRAKAADLADPRQVTALVEGIGRVDVLVNCAGGVVGQVGRPIEEISDADWKAIIDANLTTTFLCTRAVVPAMKTAGWGRIVNISSGA